MSVVVNTQISVCGICDEKVNKSTHVLIVCPYCSYEACRTCCETYILGQNLPKCMNGDCGKEWTRKFIVQSFTKTFINGDLKTNRAKILLDKEMALLPATQAIVETTIKKETVLAEAKELKKLIKEMEMRHRILIEQANQRDVVVGVGVANKERVFVRACQVDECRGFLSTQWKCGLCDTWTCPDCHVVKGKDRDTPHVCNADDVATANLLNKDTKPCPSCHTGIFKITGCDQMWCTQCHTAFSWRTGNIETRIHNPHFYEWQRRNGGVAPREPGDIICAREITQTTDLEFRAILRGGRNERTLEWPANTIDFYNNISCIIRSITHLRIVQFPRFTGNPVDNNRELRVKYMRNEIDQETFKARIHRDNKKYETKREIFDVLQVFIHSATDIIYRAKDELYKNKEVFVDAKNILIIDNVDVSMQKRKDVINRAKCILDELEHIRVYVNECLLEISHTYSSTPKQIVYFNNTNKNNFGALDYNVLVNIPKPLKQVSEVATASGNNNTIKA